MFARHTLTALALALVLGAAVQTAAAQPAPDRLEPLRQMNRILTEAGVPLTGAQVAQLRELEPGPGMRAAVGGILTDAQRAALAEAAGQRRETRPDRPGRPDGRPERQPDPRNAHLRQMNRILAAGGEPLTEDQIAALRDIERGPGAREAAENILTEAQRGILAAAGTERREDRIEYLQRVLTAAGVPLTDDQLSALREIDPEPDAREAINGILTEAQREAIREAASDRREDRQPRGDRGGRPEFRGNMLPHIGRILDEAGVPLTDEQRAALRGIEPGPGMRDRIGGILTEEQRAALAERLERDLPPEEAEGTDNTTSTADPTAPPAVRLIGNYPNPFNPATTISWELPVAADVTVSVFNLEGQRIAVLAQGRMTAGRHEVVWDASNNAAGSYVYQIIAGNRTFTGKMTLLK